VFCDVHLQGSLQHDTISWQTVACSRMGRVPCMHARDELTFSAAQTARPAIAQTVSKYTAVSKNTPCPIKLTLGIRSTNDSYQPSKHLHR
jgi:hypothetical protein